MAERCESRMRYLIREWIWGEWVFIPQTYNPETHDLMVKQSLNSDLELSVHRKKWDRFQTHSLFNPRLSGLRPLDIFQVTWEKKRFSVPQHVNNTTNQKTHVPKSRLGDVGMQIGDVGCVRISIAINSNSFSTHFVGNEINTIGIDPKILVRGMVV